MSFGRYSKAVLAVTLAVIAWGAYVRASGSGAGCGSHWPTCNGELLPRPKTVQTIIELTHRLTSGIDLLLVVGQVVWAWRAFAAGHPARRWAGLSLLFMLTEAGVGAGLVLLELVADDRSTARGLWMAMHLVNTFLLLGALTLTARAAHDDRPVALSRAGLAGWLGVGALAGALVLGTSGAVAALGDTLFPAGSLREGVAQDLAPTAHALLRLRVLHPVLALSLLGYVLLVGASWRAQGERASRLVTVTVGAFGAQVLLGFVNLGLLAPIPLQLAHLLAADAVWICLVLLVAEVLSSPAPSAVREPAGALRGAHLPAPVGGAIAHRAGHHRVLVEPLHLLRYVP
ncbi:MAG: COX15/CtaA family protein [Polyangiaceae bacterium]|nr:COX15/CtaA family protein [Polyangiaceae bacterium]